MNNLDYGKTYDNQAACDWPKQNEFPATVGGHEGVFLVSVHEDGGADVEFLPNDETVDAPAESDAEAADNLDVLFFIEEATSC